MARITSRQAQEMMDAYAKVYEIKEEPAVETPVNETPVEDIQEAGRLKNRAGVQNLLKTKDEVGLKSGEKIEVSNNNPTGTTERVGSSAGGGSTGGSTTGSTAGGGGSTQKSERPVSSAKQRWLDSQQSQKNLKDATKGYKFSRTDDGNIRADKVSGNNNNQKSTQSNNNTQSSGGSTRKGGGSVKVDGKALMSKLKADSGDKVQSSGGQQPSGGQKPQSGGGGQSTGGQKPQRGTPVNQLFGKGGSDGSPAPYTGGPDAAQRANAGNQKPAAQGGGQQQQPVKTVGGQGNRQRPVKTGGIQAGKAIRGGLSRLGSLAGKAVGAARSAAGNVAGAAGRAAGAVAGAAGRVGSAVGGALANKGPIQGRASGPQRRAQQAQTRAARPAATRPVQGQQPAAKPVVTQQAAAKPAPQAQAVAKPAPRLSGAQQAQQMAKQRIAQGRNTVTGALKSAKPKPKVTTWRELEGYDPMENLFDDTVQFLVSEGHAKDKSEAMSIMSESEFIDAFNQELNG